jgi:hypothetical protein
MFLRATTRKKDGKLHRYFSVVENRRLASDRAAQRCLLSLGEINDSQQAAWRTSGNLLGRIGPRVVLRRAMSN